MSSRELELGVVSTRLVFGSEASVDPHLPWRPLNLKVSFQRRFLLSPLLFTQQMKDLYVLENIVWELLHSGKNFRGICEYGKME